MRYVMGEILSSLAAPGGLSHCPGDLGLWGLVVTCPPPPPERLFSQFGSGPEVAQEVFTREAWNVIHA